MPALTGSTRGEDGSELDDFGTPGVQPRFTDNIREAGEPTPRARDNSAGGSSMSRPREVAGRSDSAHRCRRQRREDDLDERARAVPVPGPRERSLCRPRSRAEELRSDVPDVREPRPRGRIESRFREQLVELRHGEQRPGAGPVGPAWWDTIAPAGAEPFGSPIALNGPTVDLSQYVQVHYAGAVPTQILNNSHHIQVQFPTRNSRRHDHRRERAVHPRAVPLP